jgi:hypothetical protein
MGRNPVPMLIPCHRIIGANGTLGGYGGSTYAGRQAALAMKRHLLALEGTTTLDWLGARQSIAASGAWKPASRGQARSPAGP